MSFSDSLHFLIFFSTAVEGPAGPSLKPKSRNCDRDEGEGVGDMRASAGCEVVVDELTAESFFLQICIV